MTTANSEPHPGRVRAPYHARQMRTGAIGHRARNRRRAELRAIRDNRARSSSYDSALERRRGEKIARYGTLIGRYGVLIAPLVLVNSAAIYGQVRWAAEHLTGGVHVTAVLFALTLESIAVYLAYEAHAALIAGDASFRLRAASYLAAGVVGSLNYSHFAGDGLRPTTAAVAFGLLSAVSPWLWGIRSRSLRRDQLRAAGLIDPRSAHFAAAKWVQFPIRSVRAYRWSVDYGVREERAAWEAYREAARSRTDERSRRKVARRASRSGRVGSGEGRPGDAIALSVENAERPRRPDGVDVAQVVRPLERRGEHRAAMGDQNAVHTTLRQRKPDDDELRDWITARSRAGLVVTGASIGEHWGVSAATGRRWRQALREHTANRSQPPL